MAHDNHGSTPAAWTLVILVLAGFIVGAVGLIVASPAVFWTGVALIPVGGAVGYVMKLMGFGASKG